MAAVDTSTVTSRRAGVPEKPFLERVRLRAQRRVLWMRSLWSGDASAGEQGLAISHAEVDRALVSPQEMAARESDFYESDAAARELTGLIRDADERDENDPMWDWLRRQFGLCKHETDLLALCVAVELDPQLRRVCAYLHDDATAGYATRWLASSLFQWLPAVKQGPQSALVRWLIARPATSANNPWATNAAWVVDPHVTLWITHGATLDPALGTAVQALPAAESQGLLCLYPAQLAAMREFALALRGAPPVEINLIGAKGAGKRTLAAQVSAALGHDLICADAAMLLGREVPFALAVERAIRAARLAHLAGAFLYWREAEAANPKIWSAAFEYSALMFLGSEVPLPRQPGNPAARQSVTLPPLARSGRLALWNHISGQPAPEAIANCLLEPADIVNAARVAPAGQEYAASACESHLSLEPAELFVPLVCPYTWDDIVLPGALREHLAELERQVRLRWQVYEEWGFERLRMPSAAARQGLDPRARTSLHCKYSGFRLLPRPWLRR